MGREFQLKEHYSERRRFSASLLCFNGQHVEWHTTNHLVQNFAALDKLKPPIFIIIPLVSSAYFLCTCELIPSVWGAVRSTAFSSACLAGSSTTAMWPQLGWRITPPVLTFHRWFSDWAYSTQQAPITSTVVFITPLGPLMARAPRCWCFIPLALHCQAMSERVQPKFHYIFSISK